MGLLDDLRAQLADLQRRHQDAQQPQQAPQTAIEQITAGYQQQMGRRDAIAVGAAAGLGATVPPRPDQQYTPGQPAVIAPGAASGIFRGRLVVVQGSGPPGSGLFIYSGPAALGNLIYSEAATAGFDAVGNAVLQGATSYTNLGGGTYQAINLNSGKLAIYTATSEAGPWTAQSSINGTPAGELLLNSNGDLSLLSAVGAGLLMTNVNAFTGDVVMNSGYIIAASDPSIGGEEVWHTVPYITPGWGPDGQDLQYRLTPGGLVEMTGPLKFTSTSSGQSISVNNQFATALPAAYIPAAQRRIPLFIVGGTMPSITRNPNRSEHLLINTNGTLWLEWASAGPSTAAGQTAQFFITGQYRL